MQTIRMKVGDSLDCVGTYKDGAGTPVNLTVAGLTVTSAVLSSEGDERFELTVTPDPDQVANPGRFTILGDSSSWTPGKGLRWDVRYTDAAGRSVSTDTVIIDLSQAIAVRP